MTSRRKPTLLESPCSEFKAVVDYATLTITRTSPYTGTEVKTLPTMGALRSERERVRETFRMMAS